MGQEKMTVGARFLRSHGNPSRRLPGLAPSPVYRLEPVLCGHRRGPGPAHGLARLVLVLTAFFAGTGIVSHALDELNGRPLKTGFSDRELKIIALGGAVIALAMTVGGALIISPWILLFAAVGFALVVAYALGMVERPDSHQPGLWPGRGGFPVLIGYWAQTEAFALSALLAAGAATLLSLAQRLLSRKARFVRRTALGGMAVFETSQGEERWSREDLLNSWEAPLRLLAWAVAIFACGLLAARL